MTRDTTPAFDSFMDSSHENEGTPSAVLVVDDEYGPRQALRMLLKQEYEVLLAPDVSSAQTILNQRPTDLIITDLRMPNQSGIDLLQWVKERQPDVQVIILTGYAELETAKKAIEYGAFAYVEKPYDNETIRRHVEAGIARRRQEQDRNRFEEAIVKANRFEVMGRILGGTIHDLGAPLSVIESLLEMILSKPDPQCQLDRLATIQTQVRHCHDMVATAMNFIRHQTFASIPFQLNDVARGCLEVGKPLLRRQNVSVNCSFAPNLPNCIGDLILVRQAILNLVSNACHAMENQDASPNITLRTWTEDDFVCLGVMDNGPGIPQELRKRVFETFYTSRGTQGTGMGLSVVKNVMRRHGGHVVLRENPSGGAWFVLKFPIPR